MISHCANPRCRLPLHYLRGGRLYRLDITSPSRPCADVPNAVCTLTPSRATVFSGYVTSAPRSTLSDSTFMMGCASKSKYKYEVLEQAAQVVWSRRARQSSCPEPGLTGGCGADGNMLIRGEGKTMNFHKTPPPTTDPIHATRQYSSGNSSVVADRSASVTIHSFSPAFV
jgi:hypothetical protein